MEHRPLLTLRGLGLLCLVFCLSMTALAADGRDFSGSYRISHVSHQGNTVHLTLSLQLFNFSSGDIQDGAVALYDSEPTRSPLGGFNAIPVFHHGQAVHLSQQFTVPAAEYRRWQKGQKPILFFLSKNADGNVFLRGIDLSREMGLMAAQQ